LSEDLLTDSQSAIAATTAIRATQDEIIGNAGTATVQQGASLVSIPGDASSAVHVGAYITIGAGTSSVFLVEQVQYDTITSTTTIGFTGGYSGATDTSTTIRTGPAVPGAIPSKYGAVEIERSDLLGSSGAAMNSSAW